MRAAKKSPVVIGTAVTCGQCSGGGWINGAEHPDRYVSMYQSTGRCPPSVREPRFKPIVCPSCGGAGIVAVQP